MALKLGDSVTIRCRLILAALLLCCPLARAEFTFIHCSDVHVGAQNNKDVDAQLFTEIARLDPKPAFVFATGDICENGTDAQYADYREILKNLGDVKMYSSTGNHDVALESGAARKATSWVRGSRCTRAGIFRTFTSSRSIQRCCSSTGATSRERS